jgi:uncharacterized protein YegL
MGLLLAVLVGMAATSSPRALVSAQGNAPRCQPTRDKTAQPSVLPLGQKVTVTLELGGICPIQERKADVALVIDRSLSMVDNGKLLAAQNAAIRFVDTIDSGLVRIGLITFDGIVEEMQYLTDDKVALKRSIADIQWGRGTNLVDSLEAGRKMVTSAGARKDATPVVVFLTDGRHRVQQPPLAEIDRVIAEARAQGVVLYAIGLGADVDVAVMRRIASDAAHYYFSPGPAELEQIFLSVAGRLEAKVLFKTITVEDVIPANMRYVVDSADPPAVWNATRRSLTWRLVDVPESGAKLRFQVIPQEAGLHPTNVEARGRYSDGFDQPGEIVFPVPEVEVIPGEVGTGCVCRITRLKAPGAAIDAALAHPDRIWGWNLLSDPNKPGAPPYPEPGYDWPPNPRRTCLDIWNRGIPYHPLFNSVVWRAGCTEGPAGP